jgi:hypothetical protein
MRKVLRLPGLDCREGISLRIQHFNMKNTYTAKQSTDSSHMGYSSMTGGVCSV